MIKFVTVDDGGQRSSIEGQENRPQDRTLRDTTGEFDRIGHRVGDRRCVEPVLQIGLELTRQRQYCGFQMCTLGG